MNLPFLYHDPSKELALVYMPMEAGRTDMERQQAIGALSRAVMNQMPAEQRKSYLLSPEVFLTHESMVNRLLEAEGVTPEMIAAQEARSDLLRQLVDAESAETRTALIDENQAIIDEDFFQVLQINFSRAEAVGHAEMVQTLVDLQKELFERTPVGEQLARRSELLRELEAEPTRGKLIDLLVQAEDDVTREVLIAYGQPLLDYAFFQGLTQRLETAEDADEKRRLEELRTAVLEVRQKLQEQFQQVIAERGQLLRDLLLTEQPELLLRRRVSEIDELFFGVLTGEIEQAEAAGNSDAVERLTQVRDLVLNVLQAMVPPEITLLNQILEAEDEAALHQVLEGARQLIVPPFLDVLRQVEQEMRERESVEAAERIAKALAVAETMIASAPPEKGPRPSGLVTA